MYTSVWPSSYVVTAIVYAKKESYISPTQVVKVLQQMVEFVQLFLPEDKPNGCHGNEPLLVSVRKSIENAVNESNLGKEITGRLSIFFRVFSKLCLISVCTW